MVVNISSGTEVPNDNISSVSHVTSNKSQLISGPCCQPKSGLISQTYWSLAASTDSPMTQAENLETSRNVPGTPSLESNLPPTQLVIC